MKELEQEIAVTPCPNRIGLIELHEHCCFFFFLNAFLLEGGKMMKHREAC